MTPRLVLLKIVDNDENYYNRILDTFLVINPTQEALNGLQELIANHYDLDEIWDYSMIYDYIEKHFVVAKYHEKEIEY